MKGKLLDDDEVKEVAVNLTFLLHSLDHVLCARSTPPAPPLVAAQLRLSFSGLCHERLGSASVIKFVSGDVVGHIGHFVGVADVYQARLRQAHSIHKLRASTPGDSDEVARGA